MKFNLRRFKTFLDYLKIDTKDYGRISLGRRLGGTQKAFIRQVVQGIEEGVHEFWCLKGRQARISTIMLGFGLYWLYTKPGLRGSLVVDEEGNRQEFKSILESYTQYLPKDYSVERTASSVYGMQFANRSRLSYLVAGKKKGNERLGQGRGIAYLHATEVATWGCGEEGFASLQASLAQMNPDRLFCYESTARGFNMFHDYYYVAKKAKSKRAIFIGWWLNEDYSLRPDDVRFKTYWDGKLLPRERDWIRVVKSVHGFEISPEQVAWWRWMGAEQIKDESLLMQEYPPIEEMAFIQSGTGFFSNDRLTEEYKRASKFSPKCYRMVFGQEFYDTEVAESTPSRCDLKIWEEPEDRGVYVIGADPSYGSNPESDNGVICVYRCFANGLYQVAQYASNQMNSYQFAWVVVYLAGAYRDVTINLEVNGPGQPVISEIARMRMKATTIPGEIGKGLRNTMGCMRYYLWRRLDSLGGPGKSVGWLTTSASKERAFTHLKDYFERGMMQINDTDTLDEMKKIVREPDGSIQGSGSTHDDRAMGSALAVSAYAESVQTGLMARGMTIEKELSRGEVEPPGVVPTSERALQNYLQRVGLRAPVRMP
jgi:hypothetical protein